MDHRLVSSAHILLWGWVLVNIPVTLLIVFIFLILSAWDVPYLVAVLGGCAVGWAYWAFAVKYWIHWSHRKGFTAEHIYSIGKPGLLVWNVEMVKRVLDSGNEGARGK